MDCVDNGVGIDVMLALDWALTVLKEERKEEKRTDQVNRSYPSAKALFQEGNAVP